MAVVEQEMFVRIAHHYQMKPTANTAQQLLLTDVAEQEPFVKIAHH